MQSVRGNEATKLAIRRAQVQDVHRPELRLARHARNTPLGQELIALVRAQIADARPAGGSLALGEEPIQLCQRKREAPSSSFGTPEAVARGPTTIVHSPWDSMILVDALNPRAGPQRDTEHAHMPSGHPLGMCASSIAP